MKNLLSLITGNHKAKLFVVSLLTVTGLATATVFAGYGPNGPDRKIFDFSNPAEREGAFDGPRFNSYINTNVYGDERAFLDAKECVGANEACYTVGEPGGYADKQQVQPDKEYIVRAYVHNIANPSINGANRDGIGVAKNTRLSIDMPEGFSNNFELMAEISADNALPKMVFDTANLKNDSTEIDLDFVEGSARIYNAAHPTGLPLGDEIMSANGVLIGHDQMNGVVPGCFEFSSFVVIRVKVKAQPKLEVVKQVRKLGQTEWKESVDSKPGETVQWQVKVTNTGPTAQRRVVASDLLPPHVDYVPGTAKWEHSLKKNIDLDFNQFVINQGKGGYVFGDYPANGGSFTVNFDTKVKGDFQPCAVVVRNIAHTKSNESPVEQQDFADLKITRENCQPATVTPVSLPVTGPGGLLGIFGGVSIVGALTHRFVLGRRYNG